MGLETKYVTYNRSKEVSYRTFLKEVDRVSNVRNVLVIFTRYGLEVVTTTLVVVKTSKTISPYSSPSTCGGLSCYRCTTLLGGYTRLGSHTESRKNISSLYLVLGSVVSKTVVLYTSLKACACLCLSLRCHSNLYAIAAMRCKFANLEVLQS